jgi:hypothetical protein
LGHKKHLILLEHAAAFGKRIPRKEVYERDNGDRIDAWQVNIKIFSYSNYKLNEVMTSCNDGDDSRECWTKGISYLQKSLIILEPWIIQIGLSEREKTDVLDEGKINHLFYVMSSIETALKISNENLNDTEKELHHCEQSAYYAKQMEGGEVRTKLIFERLGVLSYIYYKVG